METVPALTNTFTCSVTPVGEAAGPLAWLQAKADALREGN